MDELTKTGIQFVSDDIKEQLIGNAEYLMNSAIKFIERLGEIVSEYEHLRSIIRLKQSQNLSQLKQVMRQSQNGLKQAIIAQYSFEEQVNTFLGRQIHFAWVDVNTAEIFLVEQIAAKQIYTLASVNKNSGFTGKIKIADKNLNNFKNKLSSLPSFLQEQYKDLVNKRVAKHQNLIRATISRLDDNLNDKNLPWYKEHNSTVYWQHPPQGVENIGKWSWSMSTKKGFISQGYVRFIFNSIEDLEEVNEFNIGHFMMNYVEKADSIPGIVKGDIIVNNTNDTVQIAVKSNTLFNTASIGPYITTAYQIISFYDNLKDLNIEKVESILSDLKDYRPKVLEFSQEKARESLEKIFKQFGAIIS